MFYHHCKIIYTSEQILDHIHMCIKIKNKSMNGTKNRVQLKSSQFNSYMHEYFRFTNMSWD